MLKGQAEEHTFFCACNMYIPVTGSGPWITRIEDLCMVCSGGFYSRNEGTNWIGTMLATANLFPLMCFGIASILNTIAIAYHSLAAVPFGSIVILLLIWMFISFPLCLFGTVSQDSCVWGSLLHPGMSVHQVGGSCT